MSTRPTETWRVAPFELALDEPESVMRERALAAAGLGNEALRGFRIARRSLDARRRSPRFVVQVDLQIDAGYTSPGFDRAVRAGHVTKRGAPGSLRVAAPHASLAGRRVVVVGAGPAGLFAALTLARNGVAVDLLDRGAALSERGRAVARFQRERVLDPESNLLYGEGGAGTYSDGKLYTRVDHPLEAPLLEELIACGAPPEIAFDARAHIGTDRLHRILPALRSKLEREGVRFHWGTRVDHFDPRDGTGPVRALQTTAGEFPCDAVFLAVGHSARDTLRSLHGDGLVVAAKPFQFGVRIEHPQPMITKARHGRSAAAEQLGPAYYSLVCKAGDGLPAAHSFCMCPGGQIVASVNAPGFLCTNGMSNSQHSSPFANAGLVVTVGPNHVGPGPFAGMIFQEQQEALFFEAGGGDYAAPAQSAPDFLRGVETARPGRCSYKLGIRPGRIDQLLPERVRDALRRALSRFERSIPGFAGPEGLLVGVESRSSGPVRLLRDSATRRSEAQPNVFPIGEGAGYAGGIMSAAIDGARSAQALLQVGLN